MDLAALGLQDVSQQTLEAIKALIAPGAGQAYQPVNGVQISKDITTASGLTAFNLEPMARLLVPAITPLRNAIPRVGNTRGGTAANWRVIQTIDIAKANIFTAEGTKAGTVNYTATAASGAYRTMSAGDNVSFQSQWAGRTFEDVRARATARLLRHVLIREEQGLIGGRSAVLAAVTAPTVTTGAGAIGAGTYNVFVRALVPLAGSGVTAIGRMSAATSTGAIGANSSISASTPYVEGASRYEWYVGTAGNEKLEATTKINSVLLTALAGTGATQAAVAAADTTNGAVPNGWDGIIAQLTAAAIPTNVRTLGTGVAGTGTAFSLTDIDDMLQNAWDNFRVDPDAIYMNSQESRRLTNLVLAAGGAPTLYVNSGAGKAEITGGYRVTAYVNKITGKQIPVVVHPYLDQGTILGLTFGMPFPASDIDNPIEIETRQEYMQLDYPVVKPAWEFEVLVDEVVKLYFPGSCFVIRNCNPSA